METPFEDYNIEVNGFEFRVRCYNDDDAEPPWVEYDGHGPVRAAPSGRVGYDTGKRPGEKPMRGYQRNYFYDWQAAAKMARKDGWNTEPYDAPNRVQRAVQADFDYLRGFAAEDWYYCGVEVKLALHPQYERSLWRVETLGDYYKECAREQAQEVLSDYLDDIQAGRLKPKE